MKVDGNLGLSCMHVCGKSLCCEWNFLDRLWFCPLSFLVFFTNREEKFELLESFKRKSIITLRNGEFSTLKCLFKVQKRFLCSEINTTKQSPQTHFE